MSPSAGSTTPLHDSWHDPDRHVDQRSFLGAMACLPSPVTVVTALSQDGTPLGTTVSAVTSLSLEPPMIAIALDARSSLLPAITSSGRFGVNVLSTTQAHLARVFASKSADRFASVDWQESGGLPRLDGIVGWVVVRMDASHRGGDHQMVMGHVEEAVGLDGAALIYVGRRYGSHTPLGPARNPALTDSSTTDRDEGASPALLRCMD